MSGEQLDTPNQQTVRADGSAAWDEGSGGGTAAAPKPAAKSKGKHVDDDAPKDAPAEGE